MSCLILIKAFKNQINFISCTFPFIYIQQLKMQKNDKNFKIFQKM